MNRIKSVLFVAIIAAAFSLTGCGDQKEPSGSQTEVTSKDIKKDAAQTIETAKAYTQHQKEEYQRQLQNKLNIFDQKLDALKNKTESMQADAKIKYEETLAELQEKQKETVAAFEKLKNESGDAWSEIKNNLDQLVDDLQRAFDQRGA
jgi:hypothetical protein